MTRAAPAKAQTDRRQIIAIAVQLALLAAVYRALASPWAETWAAEPLKPALTTQDKSQRTAASTGPTDTGAVASGRYRKLFVEAGHSQREVTAKINKAFQQLFYGNPSDQAVYFPAGDNANGALAYIADVLHNDVRSEGMSYGMMIAVQLDKKAEFDAIWNWARTYMYCDKKEHPCKGFFFWSLQTGGTPFDEMPAADGEEYFATALYFAAARWGSGSGIYDYRAQADRILTDMLHREPIQGNTVKGPITAANLFSPQHKMVRFSPDLRNSEHTDPSYHLPAFYEVWARCGPAADREFWQQAATASRDFFQRTTHPVTALSPEYAEYDGSPWAAQWNKNSDHFFADAWRTAMNWSVDWSWWRKDPRSEQLSDRLQAFFDSQGRTKYANHFTLEGQPLSADHSTGLVATNAVASLAATRPRAKAFVNDLWKTPIPSGQYRYYDGLLYMIALLHCGGEFRAWLP